MKKRLYQFIWNAYFGFGMPILVLEREEREISYKYYLFFY